eukprot:2423720-Prymnesium_polylepis.1
MERISKSMMKSLNHDVHSSIESDATVAAIHAHAEKFEPRTEMYFEYIQIFTAIVDSFAPVSYTHLTLPTICSV